MDGEFRRIVIHLWFNGVHVSWTLPDVRSCWLVQVNRFFLKASRTSSIHIYSDLAESSDLHSNSRARSPKSALKMWPLLVRVMHLPISRGKHRWRTYSYLRVLKTDDTAGRFAENIPGSLPVKAGRTASLSRREVNGVFLNQLLFKVSIFQCSIDKYEEHCHLQACGGGIYNRCDCHRKENSQRGA